MDEAKKVVTIGLSSRAEIDQRIADGIAGKYRGSHISFATPELLWTALTMKRMDIVRSMAGKGPLAIREVARRVGRDVKAVHGDIQRLINSGVVDRTSDGKVEFPYDEIHVSYVLSAIEAAA